MEGQQQGQQEGEQMWPLPQEWRQHWQERWLQYQGQWQQHWLFWQGQWQQQWLQWQQLPDLHLVLPQLWGDWQLRWQLHFQQWHVLWDNQWQQWQQDCQVQQNQHRWGWEWPQDQWQFKQWEQQFLQQRQQWQQHGEWQWRLWLQLVEQQQQVQGQQQGQEPWNLHLQFQQWQHQWRQQWDQWRRQWKQKWRQWQQGQQQCREQRHWQWRQRQHQEQWQDQERWPRLRLTIDKDMIPLWYALSLKPLTTHLTFQDNQGATIPMLENTTFGNLVADGLVNEIIAAHRQNLSWAGDFHENDLFVSEDESFVAIAKEPKKLATNANQFRDLIQITSWFIDKYTKNEMAPPYFWEFVARVVQIRDCQTERDRSTSLWVLKNHPFFMGQEKWRLFVESYYKWYTQVDVALRHRAILDHNLNICPNWHLATVRDNGLLHTVYWNGREGLIPDQYYTDGCNVPDVIANNREIFRFTQEDGYLAVFQRTFYVHGIQILGDYWSLRELALFISHIFQDFLPRFIARIYDIPDRHHLLRESLDTYVNRRSASWRHIQGRLNEVAA